MKKNTVMFCTVALGLLLIALGLMSGQAELVLAKAIRICMECVGIG